MCMYTGCLLCDGNVIFLLGNIYTCINGCEWFTIVLWWHSFCFDWKQWVSIVADESVYLQQQQKITNVQFCLHCFFFVEKGSETRKLKFHTMDSYKESMTFDDKQVIVDYIFGLIGPLYSIRLRLLLQHQLNSGQREGEKNVAKLL